VIYLGAGRQLLHPGQPAAAGSARLSATKGRFTDSYIISAQEAALRLARIEAQPMVKPIDVVFDTVDRARASAFSGSRIRLVEQGSKLGVFRTSLEAAPPQLLQGCATGSSDCGASNLYQLWR